MHRLRTIVLPLVISLGCLGAAACSGPADQAVIEQFFTASREGDRAELRSVATVVFDPATQGTVTEFTVVSMSEEQRAPLAVQALTAAIAEAEAEDASFSERKIEYQEEHMEAIQRVLKAESEDATLEGEDGDIQREWTVLREETTEHARAVSEARTRFDDLASLIDRSASTLRNPVDVAGAEGEMVTKEVTISAPVTMADGQTVEKTLVVTLQRAVITGEDAVEGRWIVTSVTEG